MLMMKKKVEVGGFVVGVGEKRVVAGASEVSRRRCGGRRRYGGHQRRGGRRGWRLGFWFLVKRNERKGLK